MTKNSERKFKKPSQMRLPEKYRIRPPLKEEQPPKEAIFKKKIQGTNEEKFGNLKDYNWKPGFEEIPSSDSSKEDKGKQLRLVESKDKSEQFSL